MDVFISNNFKGKNKLLDYQSTGVKFIFVLLPMFSLQDKFQNVLHYIDVRLVLIIRYHYDNYVKLHYYMHWVGQNIDQQNIARILMIKKKINERNI